MAKAWTNRESAIVRENWTAGRPLSQWSRLLPGRTERAVDAYARQQLGLRPLLSYRAAPAVVTWPKVAAVLDEGGEYCAEEIAQRIGMSPGWVRECLRTHAGVDCHVAYESVGVKGGKNVQWWAAGPKRQRGVLVVDIKADRLRRRRERARQKLPPGPFG